MSSPCVRASRTRRLQVVVGLVPWLVLAPSLLLPGFLPAQEIIQAAKDGRLDRVREMVAADPAQLRIADPQGYTALRWAAMRGHREVVQFLVETGADPNSVGADGGTPLHGAAHHDDVEMMALLLDAGGIIDFQNQWGRTPLHAAARRGCVQVTRLLLDRGADPNAVTRERWSPLNEAYRGGHPETVAILLARGADPNLADTLGLLPGAVTLIRPPAITLSRRQLDEYVGEYRLPGAGGFQVWREGDRLRLMEHAPDVLVPVARDAFYTVQEPWRTVFHRDGQGAVTRIEVAFLRQTVVGERVRDPSGGFAYVGSGPCLACHGAGSGGGPTGRWIASRHSRAFHTLSSDQATGLVRSREEYRDVTDPSLEPRCLACHATAAQNPLATFADGFDHRQGVGCESCHGPGAAYISPEIMTNREAFLARGGQVPTEQTCRECHRDSGFRFLEMLERVRHWG